MTCVMNEKKNSINIQHENLTKNISFQLYKIKQNYLFISFVVTV